MFYVGTEFHVAMWAKQEYRETYLTRNYFRLLIDTATLTYFKLNTRHMWHIELLTKDEYFSNISSILLSILSFIFSPEVLRITQPVRDWCCKI